MKTTFTKTLMALCAIICCYGQAAAQFTSAPAFPGAEGYGRFTTGGRGGTVYHVTRLDDYIQDADYSPNYTKEDPIPGTLRYAITRSGARTVVFDVAGTIELKCPLKIAYGDITILGQTAPGDGICLKNYTLGINANNVIIRFIRCRMGDEGKRYYSKGEALSNTAFEDDAMNSYHKDGGECRNIIIDHCSVSWCVDECGTFYGNRDFTLQWCILSESLRRSVHEKGNHGYGGIWGGERASFHHNLIAHHDSRNPRFDHGYVSTLAGPVDYMCNVVYNWGGNSSYGGENKPGYTSKKHNMVNNYYKYGPSTSDKDRLLNPTTYCTNCNGSDGKDIVPGDFYIAGNYMYGSSTVSNDNTCLSAIVMDSKGITYDKWITDHSSASIYKDNSWISTYTDYTTIALHSASNAFDRVVSYSGASFARDAVDTRVCNDAKNGTTSTTGSNGSTNGFIDTPSDAGGWPLLTGTAKTDSDGDGIPDDFEEDNGLNPNDATDANLYTLDSEKHYYTNLEVYANWLVEDLVKAQRMNADEAFEEYYPEVSSVDDPSDDEEDDDDEEGINVKVVENKFWTFDNGYEDSYTASATVDGLNIMAASGKAISVNRSSKTDNDESISFTHRLQFGGTGSTSSRNVNFTVTGPCTIDVWAVSGNNSATRELKINDGAEHTLMTTDNDLQKATYTYQGNGGTIYIYSGDSGINIYGIRVTYPAEVLVFDTNGQQTNSQNVYGKSDIVLTSNQVAVVDASAGISGDNIIVKNGTSYSCEKLVITDGIPFSAPVSFVANQVTYDRSAASVKKDFYATLYLPYAFDPTAIGLKVMEMSAFDESTGEVTFTDVSAGNIKPNTPYLVRQADYSTDDAVALLLTDHNVTVRKAKAVVAEGSFGFYGTYTPLTIKATDGVYNYYGFSTKYGDFRKASETGSKCDPFRAYFRYSSASGSKARLAVKWADDYTGISTHIVEQAADSYIYNLHGQKMGVNRTVLAPGIYIQGGHKFIVK